MRLENRTWEIEARKRRIETPRPRLAPRGSHDEPLLGFIVGFSQAKAHGGEEVLPARSTRRGYEGLRLRRAAKYSKNHFLVAVYERRKYGGRRPPLQQRSSVYFPIINRQRIEIFLGVLGGGEVRLLCGVTRLWLSFDLSAVCVDRIGSHVGRPVRYTEIVATMEARGQHRNSRPSPAV